MNVRGILLLFCAAAARELSHDALSADQMGATQLLEMKEDLKNKLESGEEAKDDEKKFFAYFKQMIINTSLKNINTSHAFDQGQVDKAWQLILDCHKSIHTSQTGDWTLKSTQVEDYYADVEECKNKTITTPGGPKKVCDICTDIVGSILSDGPPPTSALMAAAKRVPVYHDWTSAQAHNAKYGEVHTYTSLSSWFTTHSAWHCDENFYCDLPGVTTTNKADCLKKCTAECENEEDNDENEEKECNTKQREFERSVCTFSLKIKTDCDGYAQCRTREDANYNTTRGIIEEQEARRKLEYKILMTIICYIDLLTAATKPTAADKKGCEAEWDTSFLDIVYPHEPVVPAWPGVYDCHCKVLPSENACAGPAIHEIIIKSNHDPKPCTTEFTNKWYQNIPYNHEICTASQANCH